MYGQDYLQELGVGLVARPYTQDACDQARQILGQGWAGFLTMPCDQVAQLVCEQRCDLFRGNWDGQDPVRLGLCGTSTCFASDDVTPTQSDACWRARQALGQSHPAWYEYSCSRIVQHVCVEDCTLFSGGGDPTRLGLCGSGTCPTVPPNQLPPYGVAWIAHNTPQSMTSGQRYLVAVSFRNTGSLTWPAGTQNPVHLGYHLYVGSPSNNQIVQPYYQNAGPLPYDVAPGQSVEAQIWVTAPTAPGNYTVRYDMIHEGITWFTDQHLTPLDVSVNVGETPPPLPQPCVCWDGTQCPGGLLSNCPPVGAPPCTCPDGSACPAGNLANCAVLPTCHCPDGTVCPGGIEANCDAPPAPPCICPDGTPCPNNSHENCVTPETPHPPVPPTPEPPPEPGPVPGEGTGLLLVLLGVAAAAGIGVAASRSRRTLIRR